MENSNQNNGFSYTYSAQEQQELKRIRQKYMSEPEDKMTRLRRLDRGVTQKAQAVALSLGIIGTLILGLGMSLIMTELAACISRSYLNGSADNRHCRRNRRRRHRKSGISRLFGSLPTGAG